MSMHSMLTKFRSMLGQREGTVPIIFALSALGLIGTAGLATDFSRGAQTKARLMAAADSAALAAARTHGTAAEREDVAKRVFEANTKLIPDVQNVVMTPTNVLKDGKNYGFRIAVSGEMKTILGGVLGYSEIGMSGTTEAIGTIGNPTEISMVLDTTGSMSGWKMTTLKDAAVKLIDELENVSHGSGKVSYGVVPFAQYVNIGLSHRKKVWMDVPDDSSTTTTSCKMEKQVINWINCKKVWVPPKGPTPPGTCYNDGVPYSCGGSAGHAGYYYDACDPVYGPDKEVCKTTTKTVKWNGCAGSRNYPLNTRDESYGTRIPGIMNVTCGSEMLELTTNSVKAKDHIKNLTPTGETYTPSGLIWGWRMLSPQEPLAAKAKTPTENVRKFMIFMTDGLNTRSPTYPENKGKDGVLANNLAKEICANVAADKTNQIMIFSVAFDVTDTATKEILQKCATNTGGQFFDAKNSGEFLTAFSKIGQSIAELRLTK